MENAIKYKYGYHTIMNDTLVMSRFDGGYFDYDGKPHYYLTDWQGNNIGVFDRNGSMEQQVDYYPYGEPRIEPIYSQKKNVNRHLFGNKERIVAGRLNEYDFLARTYVASQCRFTTLDPLAEKTPWLSPYAYCAGNPVNFFDPDGRDIWEINNMGKLINHLTDKTQDAFYILDSDGKRMDDKSLTLPYGTIKNMNSRNTKWDVDYDSYEVTGDYYSTSLFEFLAENTMVEWSHMMTGEVGNSGQNFLTTSHMADEEDGMSDLLYKELRFLNLREYNHSHPSNIEFPSGLNNTKNKGSDTRGDIEFLNYINRLVDKDPQAFLYLPENKRYVPYTRNSKKEDFLRNNQMNVLNECVVMP